MNTTDTGGAAFPSHFYSDVPGISLRDYFAAKAMQGLITGQTWDANKWHYDAKAAYEIADAMLKEREA